MRRSTAALSLALSACTPSLSAEIIRAHPRIKLTSVEPRVIAKSDPLPPAWIRRLDRGSSDVVPFLGQAAGATLEEAKAAAERDLLAAISNFVAVEVETEFESRQAESSKDGLVRSESETREVVKTRSAARVEGVKTEQAYWEKWAASPLDAEQVDVRFYVHARVPRAAINQARIAKQLAREKQSGKRAVAILPFRPTLQSGADLSPIAAAFVEELASRLGAAPGLYVADPALVQGVASGGGGEAELIERVRDALLPDVVVSGAYQLHADRLRVSYQLRFGAAGQEVKSGAVERPYTQLFELEDALARELSAQILGAALPAERPKRGERPLRIESEQAYHLALELSRAGKNEEAVSLLSRLVQEDPAHARAQLRLGRVLERMGRLGRVSGGHAEPRRGPRLQPWECVRLPPPGERRAGASLATGTVILGPEEDVDVLLSAAAFALDGPLPDPAAPPVPRGAAAAYWNALALARAAGDAPLERLAALALADLGVRADRLAPAEVLYTKLEADAEQRGDLHLRSLCRLGLGKAARLKGEYAAARSRLEAALADRLVLGEKPYLLEIYNELGGVHVEAGRYAEAERAFTRAWRIAEDLGDDYLASVLANNLGVLLYTTGRARPAREHFARAFDHLRALAEAEGQAAAGLNLAQALGLGGDPDRAQAYVGEVERLLAGRGVQSQQAALLEAKAALALARGRPAEALLPLLAGVELLGGLGRAPDELRLHGSLIAAELEAFLADPGVGGGRANRDVVYRCLEGAAKALLREGYGDHSAERYGGRGRYRPYYQPGGGAEELQGQVAHLLARLNVRVLEGLDP